jgi:hypothetical protein
VGGFNLIKVSDSVFMERTIPVENTAPMVVEANRSMYDFDNITLKFKQGRNINLSVTITAEGAKELALLVASITQFTYEDKE